MGKTVNVRICTELEKELKSLQEELKKKIGNIEVNQTQASKMAAKILNKNRCQLDSFIKENCN